MYNIGLKQIIVPVWVMVYVDSDTLGEVIIHRT